MILCLSHLRQTYPKLCPSPPQKKKKIIIHLVVNLGEPEEFYI